MAIDLTTNIGKTRLFIPDMDEANPIFGNGEIQVFLDNSGSTPMLAAALALETVARGRSLLAKFVQVNNFRNERWSPEVIMAAAQKLRDINSNPDNSIQIAHFEQSGWNMDDFMPIWRDGSEWGI